MKLLVVCAALTALASAQPSVPQATNSGVIVNPRPKWCPDADLSLSCLCGRVMLGPCPTNVCKTCAASTTGGIEKVPHGEDRTSVVGVDAKYLSQHHLYDTAVALQKCCKICNGQNKACGDRCISKATTCAPPAIAADLPADRYCACDHLPWGPVRPQRLAEAKDALPELDWEKVYGARNQVHGDVPLCKIHKNTVYAMCADQEVARWGTGPEGTAKALKNCQWAASTQMKWGHCVHNSERSNKVAQAVPVAPADPTGRVPKSCTMGSQVVPDGDVVRGAGSNFCNSCHCREGSLVCSTRNCSPDRGEAGWHSCGQHITCSPHGQKTADGRRHILVKVRHSNKGFSGDHRCRYNVQEDTCACKCREAPKFGGRQHGVFQFDKSGTAGRSCSSHTFATGFDPTKGDVSVIISANHRKTDYAHNPPMMWVEGASHTGFTVCMREGEDQNDSHLTVSYMAYQGTANRQPQGRDTPFAGALAGYNTVAASSTSGPHCQDVKFAASFNKVPLVMGSVDFQNTMSTSSSEAVSHWLEGVSSTGFRVCFREDGFTNNGHAGFAFNWMAFPHNNPWLWYGNHMPYSEAGTVPSAGLWTYPHSSDNKQHSAPMACKTVAFKATYASIPAVLVTAKHAATTMDLAAAVTHPATVTFVNEVTTTDFEVCSATVFAEGKETIDDSLLWSYVVFGANVAD